MNIAEIKAKAKEEFEKERFDQAKELLKDKYQELAAAEQVLKNLKVEVEDLEHSIEDGTAFSGE